MRQAPATLLVVVALVCACALSSSALSGQASVEQRIARIEAHLVPGIVVKGGPPQALTMDDRMRALHTPAVSVAVLNDGAIEWARAYGVLKAGAPERATPRTRFQAASISKPVAAMAALRLVQGGRLSLDEDINAKLVSWKLPGNEFTTTEKVTLRRLLSHTAGLTVSGFPGYAGNGCRAHRRAGPRRGEAGQHGTGSRGPPPWAGVAVLGRRLHGDAADARGRGPAAVRRSSCATRCSSRSTWTTAPTSSRCPSRCGRRPPPRTTRRKANPRALSHLSRDGRRRPLDDSQRPCQVRHGSAKGPRRPVHRALGRHGEGNADAAEGVVTRSASR